MSDYLLVGWRQIHEALFCDKDGKPVISLSTLMQKYGPNMKEVGVLFEWTSGRGKRPSIVGWQSLIKKYFVLTQQEKYEEKKAKKLLGIQDKRQFF